MTILYINEQGSYIHKKSNRLLIKKDEEKLMEIPVIKLKALVLFGNVQISTQAVRLLMQNGIDISYNTTGGRFYGKTTSAIDRNIF